MKNILKRSKFDRLNVLTKIFLKIPQCPLENILKKSKIKRINSFQKYVRKYSKKKNPDLKTVFGKMEIPVIIPKMEPATEDNGVYRIQCLAELWGCNL